MPCALQWLSPPESERFRDHLQAGFRRLSTLSPAPLQRQVAAITQTPAAERPRPGGWPFVSPQEEDAALAIPHVRPLEPGTIDRERP